MYSGQSVGLNSQETVFGLVSTVTMNVDIQSLLLYGKVTVTGQLLG